MKYYLKCRAMCFFAAFLCVFGGGESYSQTTNTYYYDALGRMIASYPAGASTNYSSQYTYDHAGNRTNFNAAPFSPPSSSNVMTAGQALVRGRQLTSADGRYAFAYQTDDNLVVYQGSSVLWNAATYTVYGSFLIMQGDGNLVLYGPQGNALWWSGTAGNPGAWLVMQADGNLVIYSASGQALWDYGSGVL